MRFLRTLREPKIINMVEVLAQKEAIAKLCKKFDLSLFYVFGSLADDNIKKLSDVDVAVKSIRKERIEFDAFLKLIGEIQDIFKREDIDLVDLEEAPPPLKMNILRQGKILYVKSEKDLIAFRFNTITHYLSTSFLRRDFSRYLEYAILGAR